MSTKSTALSGKTKLAKIDFRTVSSAAFPEGLLGPAFTPGSERDADQGRFNGLLE